MILNGIAVHGLGKAAPFTELDWVRSQLLDKLDIQPYPGTFNVRLTRPDQVKLWETLKQLPGIGIDEPEENSCAAVCYPVLVNDTLRGAILVPGVRGYPVDKIEIVARESIRRALGTKDGDPITLQVL